MSLELQYFMLSSSPGRWHDGSLPITALVDEAPLAVLFDGGSATLKRLGLFKPGSDQPLLPLVDVTPLSRARLDGGQTFTVGTDVAVFGAGR